MGLLRLLNALGFYIACFGVVSLGVGRISFAEDMPAVHHEAKEAPEDQKVTTEVVKEKVVQKVADGEKLSHASQSIARMKQILSKVLGYLSDSRKERDVLKLNCVNAKLTSVKGLLRNSEASHVALQEALARGDTDVSAHQFKKIIFSLRKCEQLLADAETCVGQLAVYAGDTEVEVTIDEAVKTDPTQKPTPPPVVVRPAPASPYQ